MNKFIEDDHDYNCIQGITLTEGQVEAIEFALTKFNCIIGLKPGMGKSLVALRVAYQILRKTEKTICFIVCPKEANIAFKKELKTKIKLRYSILTTDEKKLDKKSRVYLFNYSNLDPLEEYLNKFRKAGYKVFLIADEVHLMQSADSNMSKRLRSLRSDFSCVFGLTGTPVLNALEGLWRIVDFVKPGFLGDYNQFRYYFIDYNRRNIRVGRQMRRIEEVKGYKHLDQLREILKTIIITRGIKYDVDFIFRKCELTDEEKKNYETAAKGVLDSEDNEKHIPSRLHDLQRIADGSHHLLESESLYSKAALLVSTVHEIINRGEGVLIYTEYEDTYRTLGEALKKNKQVIGYRKLHFITGKIPYKTRVDVVRNLQSGDVVVLTKAGCKSLNLQAVNNVIVYDIPFAIGDLIQLIGRVTRVDSKYDRQHVYFLEADQTIDTYKRLLVQSHSTMIQEIFGEDSNLPYYGDIDKDVMSKYRTYFKRKLLWCK